MDQSSRLHRASTIIVLLIGLTCVAFILQVVAAFNTLHTTGKLVIHVSDKNAVIAISQSKKAATTLGVGAATVRLRPGNYLLSASDAGKGDSKVVTIDIGKTQTVDLVLSDRSIISSAGNINFTGLSQLAQNGLTDTQVTNLKELFFNYKNDTRQVAIDPSTIVLEPHNPKGNDPSFGIDFSVSVDGTRYNAIAKYENLSDIQLTLTDSTSGNQKFSQNSTILSPSSNGD